VFSGLADLKVLFVRSITSCAASYVFHKSFTVTFITSRKPTKTTVQSFDSVQPVITITARRWQLHHLPKTDDLKKANRRHKCKTRRIQRPPQSQV
jgi:hypothetical protein